MAMERPVVIPPLTTKSAMSRRSVAKMTEFGAVAAGSTKAKLHAMVVGSSSSSGLVSLAFATALSSGRSVFAVAVFEVSCVRSETAATIVMTSGKSVRPDSASASEPPRAVVRPDASHPAAMAKPAPRRRRMPQGMCCCATLQVSTLSPGRSDEGTTKRRTAAPQAVAESPRPGPKTGSSKYGRETHRKTCKASAPAATTSSREVGPRPCSCARSDCSSSERRTPTLCIRQAVALSEASRNCLLPRPRQGASNATRPSRS
mmetsp:Transcript_44690/g.141795  ORF Transcript_44690/g.141795 Transcript_44690/m.141795 type:complete len:260 (-) Transcript_44690:320-1099(-)